MSGLIKKRKNNKVATDEQNHLKDIINSCREKLNMLASTNDRFELTDELVELSQHLDGLILEYYKKDNKK